MLYRGWVIAKIKITGDTAEIKKSILDLSKDVQTLGKSKVAIFDKDQKDFLAKEAKGHMQDLRKEMEKNKKEIAGALKLQQKQAKSVEDEVRNRERVTKLIQRQVKLQKDMQSMQTASSSVGASGRGGRGIMGKLGGARGMGMLGGLARFAGPVGMAGAALGFGASRVAKAGQVFQGGIDDRIALRGRGVGDMGLQENLKGRAHGAGLDAQSMRRGRLGAMDVFGKAGATQSAVLQRTEVERNFGVEQGTMTGIGGQLRGQMGGEGANKAVMTIQASLIASGITDEIGPYLETAAQMLTTLNENGFTFNDSAMAVLNNLANSGVASERAGKMVGGVDKAIRGSSGEANAFLQNVFKGAGVGGGTVGGIQASMRSGGLFGADLGKSNLSKTDEMAFKGLGMGGKSGAGTGQQVAKSFTKKMDEMFGTEKSAMAMMKSDDPALKQQGQSNRLQKNNFIMNAFGLENEVQAGEVSKMLTELGSGTTEKRKTQIQKRMKELEGGNSELGNLKLIQASTDGTWDAIKKMHTTVQDELGSKAAPALMSIDKTMIKIDQSISALLDFLGIETAGEKANKTLSGDSVLDQKTFDQATMGDPKKEKEFSKNLANEFSKNQKRIDELKAKGADTDFKRTGRGVSTGSDYNEWFDLTKKNKNISDSFRKVEGADASGMIGDDTIRGKFSSTTAKQVKEETAYNESFSGKKDKFWKNLFGGGDDEYKSTVKRGKEGILDTDKASNDLPKLLKAILEVNKANVSTNRSIERKQGLMSAVPAKSDKIGN